MRDLKFACPHCEQHIQCGDDLSGKTITCPACGETVLVPAMPDEHHLRITTGRVPVPTHAHGAPRAVSGGVPVVVAPPTPPTRWSRYAIASLALAAGSLILGPFGCVPGIVFGHIALAEIRRQPSLEGQGLARAGLAVGYGFLVLFTGLGLWLGWRWLRGG
ncbi:MAG: DUF4190 domain-containing protein [Limisphaerales bacterium]